MSKPVLYLSGPMSGLPDYNRPAFHAAAKALRGKGYAVLNPAENTPPNDNPSWLDWMRVALRQMLDADAVALLPGWSQSRGACIEQGLGVNLWMRAWTVDAWLADNE